jgi:hypothetical protein
MYSENQKANSSQLVDAKPTEFQTIASRLEQESSRFYNLSNELLRKADSVMRFPGNDTNPEAKSPEPNDFVSKIWYEINTIQKQNDKLQYLLDHLNKII